MLVRVNSIDKGLSPQIVVNVILGLFGLVLSERGLPGSKALPVGVIKDGKCYDGFQGSNPPQSMSILNGHSHASQAEQLDVLIVGAGFGGLYNLHHFRKAGYTVRLFEAGEDIGGIWYWNCYPGARVDSPVPVYEFSMEEVWTDWNWTERFPGWAELRAYFRHVEERLHLKKDITFNARVISAQWDESTKRWTVETQTGIVVHPRFLIFNVGFASKPYIPASFQGLESYNGICHHTAMWPQEGVDFRNKKVAVIGTGASGVQTIQEVGPIVAHLTVFQRTPNITIPMRQRSLDVATQAEMKELYPTIFRHRLRTYSGYIYDRYHKEFFSATPEERRLHLEELWAKGSIEFLVSNYRDLRTNQEVNDQVYEFWKKKVRARIRDPKMQEKLAPTIPPHPLGAKRTSLEQTYYEVYNQSNVDLIDMNANPIAEFTTKGIKTADGIEHEFDIIVLATGFETHSGMLQVDIRGSDGLSLADKWKNGFYTNLGMTVANFPNMFFAYGPQGPTAFANGPTCTEVQGDWILKCINYLKSNNFTRIEATHEAEVKWREVVLEAYDRTLLKKARSWWNGGNIPGKALDPLSYGGGLNVYAQMSQEKADNNYEGFVCTR
ncbi:cyclopentanone -monooxygenase [Moniliophthora roreri MCA 2997]|uniref:Cyclopentanone-monooxygenase n=1 Tax=Moniliophthora roreri (strain MCA 2997) TaxID=1381753 RepID=V2YVI3_MONRO|nr:cyclopentanone -monooxygenase [Moniliophthora roreri MCA 2997]